MQAPQLDASARRVVIIGAGPGGLCMGMKLKEAGFELKTDWSRPYGTQPEILAYLEHCAQKYGMYPYIRFDTEVRKAIWDEECLVWRLTTAAGEELTADVVVSAIGMFNELQYPDIEGLDHFGGTRFHSALWPRDHDLSGERVGVIGSAASAVQFVPEVAKQAGQLHVFQRTANWVVPRDDEPYDAETLERFRRDPSLVRAHRLQIWRNVERAVTFPANMVAAAEQAGLRNLALVDDPEVRARLTPTHPYGCKRPLISNDWYPAFNRPTVELVTDQIEAVTPTGIRTADSKERPVDTIVLATGFKVSKYLSVVEVTGRDGVRLDDAWTDGAQAYLGMTTAGFPNLLMLYGPNTNGGSSMITMLELEVAYVMRQLRWMESADLVSVEVRQDVQDAYNDQLQADIEQIDVWHHNCSNYYAESGRVVTQYPHPSARFGAATSVAEPEAFITHPGLAFAIR